MRNDEARSRTTQDPRSCRGVALRSDLSLVVAIANGGEALRYMVQHSPPGMRPIGDWILNQSLDLHPVTSVPASALASAIPFSGRVNRLGAVLVFTGLTDDVGPLPITHLYLPAPAEPASFVGAFMNEGELSFQAMTAGGYTGP